MVVDENDRVLLDGEPVDVCVPVCAVRHDGRAGEADGFEEGGAGPMQIGGVHQGVRGGGGRRRQRKSLQVDGGLGVGVVAQVLKVGQTKS